jgi:hypothetical protein
LSIILFVPRAAKLKASELVVDDDGVVREKLASDVGKNSAVGVVTAKNSESAEKSRVLGFTAIVFSTG